MDAQSIDQLMMLNGNKLPMETLQEVRNMLEGMDAQTARIRFAVMKDPLIALILSIFAGTLGVDRIYVGDIGLGVLKLITCGGFFIWYLYDLFVIMDKVREKNYWLLKTGVDY